MPFTGSCTNTMALEISASPTLADGVTPAAVDDTHPIEVVSTDGVNTLSTAPDPTDPTNHLKCVIWMPDTFTGDLPVSITLDADLDADEGSGDADYKPITDTGIISFHSPEAAAFGTTVGAEVPKPI